MNLPLPVAYIALFLIFISGFAARDAVSAGPKPKPGQSEFEALGEYLTAMGDCIACHTVRGGKPFAGGLELPTPFGKLYAPNITPDFETGIGGWTSEEFWRAMHEGRRRDGSFLYPAFPFNNYTKVSRRDVNAIYAYLLSQEPVNNPNRENEMRFPFNQRELLVGWRTLYFKAGVFEPNLKESEDWNRGAYLVEGLGHCNACHANRNMLGAVQEDDVSGGLIPVQNWFAPSLDSHTETGLGGWELDEIVELLKTGVSERAAVFGPMTPVVAHSLQYATDSDLRAMAVYLKTQAERAPPPGPTQMKPGVARIAQLMSKGKEIYDKMCIDCHKANGKGAPRAYPHLAGNRSILMEFPINPIRMTLVGGFPPSTQGNPRPYGMPPFGHVLNDEEVASVVTYIRRSWGNKAHPVSPAEVNNARGVPID